MMALSLSFYYFLILQCTKKCGGTLAEGPLSGHSIELAFPELFPDVDEVDEDLFKVEFVKQCVEQMEFLNLEDYR